MAGIEHCQQSLFACTCTIYNQASHTIILYAFKMTIYYNSFACFGFLRISTNNNILDI